MSPLIQSMLAIVSNTHSTGSMHNPQTPPKELKDRQLKPRSSPLPVRQRTSALRAGFQLAEMV
ncbi:hypothetical protein PHLCEN_2v6152 [Hermanssonia centrifuga]|uniref:Uncharacterized protein n=1 Tax=Hermanssonia centrifuga TaxID=98765 RepID=A0A2R6P099_9APHY|nr:hypothetical protein PHLCEN_2v6152 [Hermanssonia centrifuga]